VISFKKAIFALGLGIGMAAAMNSWAAPGCLSCLNMSQQCEAGDQNACHYFEQLGCARYGDVGAISCGV
jgi:hypothetical protein